MASTKKNPEKESFSAILHGADVARAQREMLRAGCRSKADFVRLALLSGGAAELIILNQRIGRLGQAVNGMVAARAGGHDARALGGEIAAAIIALRESLAAR